MAAHARFQQRAALFKSSVRDAVLAQSASATRAVRDDAAGHALAAHGLPGMADALGQSVLGLPVHPQRAINILAHALPSPSLLMVDEPTYGLPPDAALSLVDWLRMLAGTVRLLVTPHHHGQARRLADRVRNIRTYYVQTREQEVFLEPFEQDILRRM